jgi:hypothetical protein
MNIIKDKYESFVSSGCRCGFKVDEISVIISDEVSYKISNECQCTYASSLEFMLPSKESL